MVLFFIYPPLLAALRNLNGWGIDSSLLTVKWRLGCTKYYENKLLYIITLHLPFCTDHCKINVQQMFYRLPICFIVVKLHSRSVSTLLDFSHIEVNFVWKVQQQCVCSLHLFYWQDILKPFWNDWRLCSGHALEIKSKQWNSEQLWIQRFPPFWYQKRADSCLFLPGVAGWLFWFIWTRAPTLHASIGCI